MGNVSFVVAISLAIVGCSYERPADVPGDASLIVDAPPDVMIDGPSTSVLGEACDPLDQNSCGGTNGKCGWFIDQDSPPMGHSGCAPSGTAALGQACTYGPAGPNGFSNCAEGAECFGGVCQTICAQPSGDPTCDQNHSCTAYSGVFESGSIVAGGCVTKCNPLTQALAVGTPSAACGSTNPAAPNKGCYSADRVTFTCAPVPSMAANLTDRMTAFGPAGGGAFVNGCAPGYLPFFRESTGSTAVTCTGLCAPAKTDSSSALAGNVRGNPAGVAKLHNAAAPAAGDGICVSGKKGSQTAAQNQNCLFMWFYTSDQQGNPIDTPFGDNTGLCFAPQFFNYDHDSDPGTMNRVIPSCHTLAPRLAPPSGCTCDAMGICSGTGCPDGLAHQWGCYPKADSLFTFNGKLVAPRHPAAPRFRLGYKAEALARHVLP